MSWCSQDPGTGVCAVTAFGNCALNRNAVKLGV
jgi:hypothetical protein